MSELICPQLRNYCPTSKLVSCSPTKEQPDKICHPTLRTNFDCSPAQYADCASTQDAQYRECLNVQDAQYAGHDPCCGVVNPIKKECNSSCPGHIQFPSTRLPTRDNCKEIKCAAGKCSLGICCCENQNEVKCLHSIPSESRSLERKYFEPHVSTAYEKRPESKERSCCRKEISWTEPRICRCDKYDPNSPYACECECGGMAVVKEQPEKPKAVRFADEVTYVDCDKEFQSLKPEDTKNLCRCCQECAKVGSKACVGRPVLVYELPEPILEDTSVTQKDFCWKKTPQKEVPPWHPNIKDRWRHLDVPSLAETTYQTDFKPPPVTKTERPPVYLAPQREEKDPCKQLSEEFSTWKKTSTGPAHVYHSNCPKCDADLHRVHLHECDVRHLPPQYQCHGDGHINDCTQNKFTLCETGDSVGSKYWWKRGCCKYDASQADRQTDVPPNLLKPECPSYTTCYKKDFREPEEARKNYLENCDVCENFAQSPKAQEYRTLCTKDPNQLLITQRGGII